jgi:hypothetical protein
VYGWPRHRAGSLAEHLEHCGAGYGALSLAVEGEEAAVERDEGLEGLLAAGTNNLCFVDLVEKVHVVPF